MTQLARCCERALHCLCAILAAILVAVEIVVLFAGVMARYVFQTPLVWSDELASILFLWLAMLGSVIALQRSEHMRLTAVLAGLRPVAQLRAEAVAATAVAAFLLLIVVPGANYAAGEWFIQTPALDLHNTFRAAALPVGAVLMLISALARLVRLGWKGVISGVATIGLLAIGIIIVRPNLEMPAVTRFIDGSGPVWAGSLFPFLFITIACGSVSGWHALIASGTTPTFMKVDR